MDDFKFASESTKLPDTSAFGDVLNLKGEITADGDPVGVLVYHLPDIWLPTGKIIACDGFIMDREPFTHRIKPGRYPVTLAIADFANDERISIAQIRFAERSVSYWEMALIAGQDITTLELGYVFGYGVDSGTGCFVDPQAVELIKQAIGSSMTYFDEVNAEMNKVYKHTRSWVHVETAKGSAVLFSSGNGDGVYASYFGLDESSEPVAIITDFNVLDWRQAT
jgi:hypothetical protein